MATKVLAIENDDRNKETDDLPRDHQPVAVVVAEAAEAKLEEKAVAGFAKLDA
jgi:hypothetical protein